MRLNSRMITPALDGVATSAHATDLTPPALGTEKVDDVVEAKSEEANALESVDGAAPVDTPADGAAPTDPSPATPMVRARAKSRTGMTYVRAGHVWHPTQWKRVEVTVEAFEILRVDPWLDVVPLDATEPLDVIDKSPHEQKVDTLEGEIVALKAMLAELESRLGAAHGMPKGRTRPSG